MNEINHELGIIALESCRELGQQVNKIIQQKRNTEESFLIPTNEIRFSNGEGKVKLPETVRGKDIYILCDVGNYSCTYKMFGFTNHKGPDEHFQDIKRTVSAIRGKAARITVIMPLLYQSRQHRRKGRESLDCALALQELERLGVDVGLFYKRRDHSTVVNGKNPIVDHEYMGREVEGKDVLIVDDMIASGESVLDIALELKKRNAKNVYVATTFAFFTEGLEKFNKYYSDGIISKVYSTNLTYISPELRETKWFNAVDMSEFLSRVINRLNYGKSIAKYMDATRIIRSLLK